MYRIVSHFKGHLHIFPTVRKEAAGRHWPALLLPLTKVASCLLRIDTPKVGKMEEGIRELGEDQAQGGRGEAKC